MTSAPSLAAHYHLVCRCVRQVGRGDRVGVHFSARLGDSRGRVIHDSRVGELQQPIHFQVGLEKSGYGKGRVALRLRWPKSLKKVFF